MPCVRRCGQCDTTTGTTVTPADAAQRQVRPYSEENEGGGFNFWDVIQDAWGWIQDWINSFIGSSENLQYLAALVNMRQAWIGPLPINIVEQEMLNFEGEVTRYPIEDKTELADHMHNQPKKIVLKAWLGTPNPMAAMSMFTGQPILDTSPTPLWKILMIELEKLQRDKTPVWYVSGLQVIPRMVVTKFRPLLQAPHENAVLAEIVLEQVMFGEVDEEEVKEGVDLGTGDQSSDSGDQGTGDGEPSDGEQSLLDWIIGVISDWLFGGGGNQGGGEGGEEGGGG